jgi:UDP-N-acetylmuramate--alanine ligase
MKIHFIGIGGIGLSALAKFMHIKGNLVSGSDIKSTSITDSLKELGLSITLPHSKSAITKDIDLIVYSAVIKDSNEEIVKAKELGIKTLSRSEFLPYFLNKSKVYSVCGAHGKSTTTAILATILNSSALIGAESKEFGSNMRYNSSEVLTFEADESDGSFLNSNPYCAVVTNAEPEHMEYYNYNLDKFYKAYSDFLDISKIKIINAEDEFLSTLNIEATRLYPSKDINSIEYTLIDDEPYSRFTLKEYGEFLVWGFGFHIVLDASLAILAAINELDIETIRENIKNYKGIKKRFDILCKSKDFVLIDDYAHHPTEIKVTIESAKNYMQLKKLNDLIAIWQPHKFSRTIDNFEEFKKSFKGCDRVIIMPVYSTGEKYIDIDFLNEFNQYSVTLVDSIKRDDDSILLLDRDTKVIDVINYGLVIGFGAGDITYKLRGLE